MQWHFLGASLFGNRDYVRRHGKFQRGMVYDSAIEYAECITTFQELAAHFARMKQ